jgi:hypothetical protein
LSFSNNRNTNITEPLPEFFLLSVRHRFCYCFFKTLDDFAAVVSSLYVFNFKCHL